ncbi:unnamed protein product, partial [Amaranthus hypochondriacus]
MDFHALPRKELQSLCKKHGIPANLKNVEMADRLSSLVQEEKPLKRGRSCLKKSNDVVDDEEVCEIREPKKVKFSPQNETFIFEKTDPRERRLLARKTRGFGKSKSKENTVLVTENLSDGVDKNVDKPVEGILTRKSVVVKSDLIVESKIVDKPVERISRRKSVVFKPNIVDETQIVDKPVERISRRKSVVVKPNIVDETQIVDDVVKPVGRISRRKSVVVKPNTGERSEIIDDIDKPGERIPRRKSVVVKPDSILDSKVINDVEKPVGRRRKSVMVKSDTVLDSNIVDNVEKACTEGGNPQRNLRPRGKMKSVDDLLLSPCVVKKVKGNRKGRGSVEEVDVPLEELVVTSKEIVETSGKDDDDGVGNMGANNLADRDQARRPVKQVKKVKAGGKAMVSKGKRNDDILDQADGGNPPKNLRPRSKKMCVDDLLLSPCVEKKVKRNRKERGFVEVDGPLEELVVTSTEIVTETLENDDYGGVGNMGASNLAEQNQANRPVRHGKKVKTGGYATVLKVKKNGEVLDHTIEKNDQKMFPDVVVHFKKGNNRRKKPSIIKKQDAEEVKDVVVEDLGEGHDGANHVPKSEGVKSIGSIKTNNYV